MSKVNSDKDLRENGYLTIDEFLNLLIPGLKEYMFENWGASDENALHHPEDLFANASCYVDAAMKSVGSFGVNPNKIKKFKSTN